MALEAAMRVFWQKGYEGTSLSDLTEAMGINRPSMYAAFGNKEELFRKVFERYGERAGAMACQARACGTAREAVEAMLLGAADALCDPDHPGCLSVVGALACSDEGESIRQTLSTAREESVAVWRQRFEQGIADGDLPAAFDAEGVARFMLTVLNGMSVQARSGATRDDLRRVAEIALRAWPG